MGSPRSASITARSSATPPGSCLDCRCRNDTITSDIAADRPVASAQIHQQPTARMTNHAAPVGRDNDLGTRRSMLHLRVPFAWHDGIVDKSYRPR